MLNVCYLSVWVKRFGVGQREGRPMDAMAYVDAVHRKSSLF